MTSKCAFVSCVLVFGISLDGCVHERSFAYEREDSSLPDPADTASSNRDVGQSDMNRADGSTTPSDAENPDAAGTHDAHAPDATRAPRGPLGPCSRCWQSEECTLGDRMTCFVGDGIGKEWGICIDTCDARGFLTCTGGVTCLYWNNTCLHICTGCLGDGCPAGEACWIETKECGPLRQVGEPCVAWNACVPGAACKQTRGGFVCVHSE